MKFLLPVILLAVVNVSCQPEKAAPKRYFDIDSLIDHQINFLIQKNASVTKTASVENNDDQSTFKPDSAGWASELSVFRHLDVMNKPIYAGAFTMQDGLGDQRSNLLMRIFRSSREVPVKDFKIYYLTTPDNVRKIEATISEQNALYFTSRRLILDFEDYSNRIILSRYRIEGVQKMILRDSVKFSISGVVEY